MGLPKNILDLLFECYDKGYKDFVFKNDKKTFDEVKAWLYEKTPSRLRFAINPFITFCAQCYDWGFVMAKDGLKKHDFAEVSRQLNKGFQKGQKKL